MSSRCMPSSMPCSKRRPGRYELIFVDDGSTDGTTARLEAIERAGPGACAGNPAAAKLRPDGGAFGRA